MLVLTIEGVGATNSPSSAGVKVDIFSPSLGDPISFPINSYLNKKISFPEKKKKVNEYRYSTSVQQISPFYRHILEIMQAWFQTTAIK